MRGASALFDIGIINYIWSTGIDVSLLASVYMALLETDFAGAIEEFAVQWQKSLGDGDAHMHGDWEDVRVLKRVC